ncbi:hypothetical protein NQ166_03885 [Microbacterium sp. zg.Y1090]|uniref:hypothetical protein n=1 Tax=Microbacterium TaxID=33882 RepID=UPI00214BE114|nr:MULTISPECIES: hypothetical protein [unclassified Microbacterium]MCR2813698.1 hypothetical protein [Microbacterium sp. zg.Y1084]MCR2817969.1 hypothetical protein [Microbacterium sp. zg.Y1090]MDL5487823.1 hypothetical protein [Microbacterium sp. zg-Y1211]WIM27867.1 hypothetical protein QNO26_12030 [Microbacterium sp. zg-Y1090]
MKTWVVRFVSLYVFNVVVLLLLGALLPTVRVGWAALWAGVLLTAGTIWLKPAIAKLFRGIAARSASRRNRLGEKVVQAALVFVVELVIWVLVVVFSAVAVTRIVGWLLPPLVLLLAWIVYDIVDDRLEARAAALYDRALGGRRGTPASTPTPASAPTDVPRPSTTPPPPRPAADDGLTEEQRRMLDELGKG